MRLFILLILFSTAVAAQTPVQKKALKDYENALKECRAMSLQPQVQACLNEVEERADPAMKHNKITDKQRDQARKRAKS